MKKTLAKVLTEILFLPLSICFLELVLHFVLLEAPVGSSLLIIAAASVAAGAFLTLLITLFKGGFQKFLFILVLLLLAILFGFHMVYYHVFHSFFLWDTIGLAGDITEFYREAWEGIKECWYMILAAIAPLLIYVILIRRVEIKANWKDRIAVFLLAAAAGTALYFLVSEPGNKTVINHLREDSTACYQQSGVLVSTAADVYQIFYGVEEEVIPEVPDNFDQLGKTDVRASEPKLVLKNAQSIDFKTMISKAPNATIKEMHQYFQSKQATSQNDYTGMFKGKNLIFLTLEGFSYKAISKEITPTLYKMYTEGFVFTNFYDGLWGGSTATGEYSNMTGNFYPSASCLKQSASTLQPLAMGNLFKNAGYNTYAYHNGTYTYYSRHLSHPNFGYTYKAMGNGLKLDYTTWPNSDYQMAKHSIGDYINSKKPFHAYYMTISGHTNYTWTGNNMARNHQKDVQSLKYSEGTKAYIATQIEVEKALTYLCEELEKAGKLEDTVFAMCTDHYPYGLPDENLAELYGLPVKNIRGNVETYHNAFILWSASMKEPVVIDTPCAAYDMMPTLANLFGLEYDSRFYTGTDILGEGPHIAIINTMHSAGGNWNWKTEEGSYSVVTKKFTKSKNCTLETTEAVNAYVNKINNTVSKMRKYSNAVLDQNYYKYVFNAKGQPLYKLKQ